VRIATDQPTAAAQDYAASQPAEAAGLNETMSRITTLRDAALAGACDFGDIQRLSMSAAATATCCAHCSHVIPA
jgi:hypothetical protein